MAGHHDVLAPRGHRRVGPVHHAHGGALQPDFGSLSSPGLRYCNRCHRCGSPRQHDVCGPVGQVPVVVPGQEGGTRGLVSILVSFMPVHRGPGYAGSPL